MLRSTRWRLSLLILVLPVTHSALQAQESTAIERTAHVATALEVRDSLLGEPNTNTVRDEFTRELSSQHPVVSQFMNQPFDAPRPPTLAEIDLAIRWMREHRIAGGSGFNAQAALAAGPVALTDGSAAVKSLIEGSTGVWMPPTQLIIGFTDFLVARAQDEVVFAFVLGLERALSRLPEQSPERILVRKAFPRSVSILEAIRVESFQSLLPTLRTAFTGDLETLPTAIGDTAVLRALGWNNDPQRTYAQGLAITFARAVEIGRGTPPIISISRLAHLDSTAMAASGPRSAFRFAGALAREHAISGEAAVAEALKSPHTRAYLLAFLGHEAIDVGGAAAALVVTEFLDHLRSHQAEAVLLANQLAAIRTTATSGQPADSAGAGERTGAAMTVRSTLQILASASRLAPAAGTSMAGPDFVGDAIQLHDAVVERRYPVVANWLISRAPTAMDSPAILRFVSLGTALASAETSEEISSALRTAAAPVGSYRSKRGQKGRLGPLSLSLTAYAGGSYGWEDASGSGVTEGSGRTLGFALPVGVEVGTGIPIGSLSLFASVADLGNLASARLGNDSEVSSGAEIGWEQIIAPGLFGILGISSEVPLSVGFGYQQVNGLREAQDDGRDLDVRRWVLMMAADLTILRF